MGLEENNNEKKEDSNDKENMRNSMRKQVK